MDITEVRVKLMNDKSEKLQAFCSITISNDFVVRDLKIIEGTSGPFVAMPSRKLTDRCPKCGYKNHLRANHCSDCGTRLRQNRGNMDDKGRTKLHADIAHPINSQCREELQKIVLAAYHEELARSRQEGYVPPKYDDFDQLSTDTDKVEVAGGVESGESPPELRKDPELSADTDKVEVAGGVEPRESPPEPRKDLEVERTVERAVERAPEPAEPQPEPQEEKLDAALDSELDSPLGDRRDSKMDKENDDFGAGIFT